MAHGLVHLATIAKAHLDLGRVNVDVDARRVQLQVQHVDRLARAVQHVVKGRARGVADDLVAHEAAVDVGVLLVGAGACGVGQADAAVQAQRAVVAAVVDGDGLGNEVVAQHVTQALGLRIFGRATGAPLLQQTAFVPDRKAHVGTHQRMAAHGVQAMREFGGVGLEEFAPRRRAEEQLAHVDGGAARARRRAQLATVGSQLEGAVLLGGARQQRGFGDRADGGQGFAAETHGGDRFQVVQRADLAGGMAAQCHRQLFARDAVAIVLDPDAAHAAGQQPHCHLAGAGVERVVDQLAHHGGRAFDHLAGGDLADQFIGQFADAGAGRGGGVGHRQAGLRRLAGRARKRAILGAGQRRQACHAQQG